MFKNLFQNNKRELNSGEDLEELKGEITKMKNEQRDFLSHAHKILQSVLDHDKKKFMYEVRQEDVQLIEDGKKYRAIRKIID